MIKISGSILGQVKFWINLAHIKLLLVHVFSFIVLLLQCKENDFFFSNHNKRGYSH